MLTDEQKMLITDEPEQRERIAELIAKFSDRNRVEVLVEYQGGLLPCSFWRGVWPGPVTGEDRTTVALTFDPDLPGAMADKLDPLDDPLAIGLDAIEDFAGTEVYTDISDYMETALPCALIVDMLIEEKNQ